MKESDAILPLVMAGILILVVATFGPMQVAAAYEQNWSWMAYTPEPHDWTALEPITPQHNWSFMLYESERHNWSALEHEYEQYDWSAVVEYKPHDWSNVLHKVEDEHDWSGVLHKHEQHDWTWMLP